MIYSITNQASNASKSLVYATVYIRNVCESYPDLYNFIVENLDEETVELLVRVVYLLAIYLFLAGIHRTIRDPFGVRANTKVVELENKLTESEDLYSHLYGEKCEDEEKIVDLTKKLQAAETALAEVKSQYLCCRNAAQAFLDSTSESDTQG